MEMQTCLDEPTAYEINAHLSSGKKLIIHYNSKDRRYDLSFRGRKGELQNKNIYLHKYTETHTKKVLFQNKTSYWGRGRTIISLNLFAIKSKNRFA